ncbi:GNAT family N-acetyltransferase [Anaeropeptidivorans aminofermentans]|uniref:GNAT family N-acetyltransferase n=1 Tax=Anaeropeptidivorans aminofermentans TaxID=2934315 RepID=UPI002024C8E0|nr:GNAT family N-acetyltransferase [Anaeropeptidivorans aminofermentans]
MIYENTPTIETKRLILRKFTEDDIPNLLEIMSDKEVNTFLPWFPLENLSEAKDFLEKNYLSYYEKASAYRYAICLKESNRPIGYVNLSGGESNDFGYGLRKEFWHKGIVTEAAKTVIEKIKNAGYLYITATHDVNNPRSGEVMKRLGMSYCYSYIENWQPKDIFVTFRMYQLNFNKNDEQIYMGYWNRYENHFV